jgi:hypothetical protein
MISALVMALTLQLAVPQSGPSIVVLDLTGGKVSIKQALGGAAILSIDPNTVIIAVGGGTTPIVPPTPEPAPPIPDPKPTPITGMLWVTYIVPATRTPEDSAPISDATIHKLADGKNASWRVQTIGDAELTRRKFDDIVAAGVPVTVFQNFEGKILKTLKGHDAQAIADAIKAFKGL